MNLDTGSKEETDPISIMEKTTQTWWTIRCERRVFAYHTTLVSPLWVSWTLVALLLETQPPPFSLEEAVPSRRCLCLPARRKEKKKETACSLKKQNRSWQFYTLLLLISRRGNRYSLYSEWSHAHLKFEVSLKRKKMENRNGRQLPVVKRKRDLHPQPLRRRGEWY